MRFFLTLFLLSSAILSQAHFIVPTPGAQRTKSLWRNEKADDSMLASVKAVNIGPTIFNGRVADLDVNPADPAEFFVAYASGGLWYTKNNGTTFTPLFQQETVMTIGDIAVDWKAGTIYLGSGEQNSSRSSYAGNGMYKSMDMGKTWSHIGLEETHHISKVVVHPEKPETVWVAALGHLYSNNADRGMFKTTDGGKTWMHTLIVNDSTGASDLVIHPKNPDIVYAATWERTRKAWQFTGSGKGSGIYKSIDGGETWKRLSDKDSGFVQGDGTGRIGLAITEKEGKDYLYAVVDNNHPRKDTKPIGQRTGLTADKIREMDVPSFLALDESALKKFMEDNRFPKKYKVADVLNLVKQGKITPIDVATYNEDANARLISSPVIGAEVYLSIDQGNTWKKTHEGYLDDVYFSYGYYFGQIRVQPQHPEKVYIFGVPILRSDDGGKTWESIDAENVHSDHHALWLNPLRPGHLINGNDGGVNISYDDGKSWMKCTHPEVGQFYYVNVDNNEPYNVYGGTQDNGVWMGSHLYTNNPGWQSSGDYPYDILLGGDGMQVQIDNRDNATIYAGFQFGNYFRINKAKRERMPITPRHDLGQAPYRWNWMTPILLSSHNQDIVYMGSQKVLRSMNQGKDFVEISPDLTNGPKDGNVPYATITTLDESKLRFGLLYAGTDDGQVHLSRDGGYSWQRISDGLPQGLWVSRVQASQFEEGTVYVTLNGYRNDHFAPYVYRSDDYGQSWTAITNGLPGEPVNVIKEDPADKDILYVGTDHGVWVSLDRGNSYQLLSTDMPRTPVHDLVVQKKARDLIIGTHGRSIYRVSIANLPALKGVESGALQVFKPRDIRYRADWGKIRNPFTPPAQADCVFEAFSDSEGAALIEIQLENGKIADTIRLTLKKGLATYSVPLHIEERNLPDVSKWVAALEWGKAGNALVKADNGLYYPAPGKYKLLLRKDKKEALTTLSIVDN